MASRIPNLGNRWKWVVSFTPRQLFLWGRAPCTFWTGGCFGPRACLDARSVHCWHSPNSVQHNPSSEATTSLVRNEITRISLSRARWMQSVPTDTIAFLKHVFNIILPPTPRSYKWSFVFQLSPSTPYIHFSFPHACYMPRPPHSAWLDNLQRIWSPRPCVTFRNESPSWSVTPCRPFSTVYSIYSQLFSMPSGLNIMSLFLNSL